MPRTQPSPDDIGSDKPKRIQRRRHAGWRMPPNTVSVTRPGIFGNPFRSKEAEEAGYTDGPKMAVWAFREWLRGEGKHGEFASYERERRQKIEAELPKLRGKNLACFCAIGQPCHGDVLLEIANR